MCGSLAGTLEVVAGSQYRLPGLGVIISAPWDCTSQEVNNRLLYTNDQSINLSLITPLFVSY